MQNYTEFEKTLTDEYWFKYKSFIYLISIYVAKITYDEVSLNLATFGNEILTPQTSMERSFFPSPSEQEYLTGHLTIDLAIYSY